MIIVIADDLTGAAELAGIAFSHGLTAEVQTEFSPKTDADIICLDTNTRILTAEDATAKLRALAKRIVAAKPDWIYKKTDSVLRGNIAAELHTLLEATARTRAIFVPANPSRQRVVREGHYFIQDTPLHETDFANDPHHPATTSVVSEIVGNDPAIHIPDARSKSDLDEHTLQCDSLVLPAGAADFFTANLRAQGHVPVPVITKPHSGCTLFVCGSMSAWANQRAQQCETHGVPVCSMPEELLGQSNNPKALHDWVSGVCAILTATKSAMLAIGRQKTVEHPALLEDRLGHSMAMILAQMEVKRLLLEGGSIASAALRRMKWTHLRVVESAAFNLPGLEVPDRDSPRVFMKPGSYDWPETIWPHG